MPTTTVLVALIPIESSRVPAPLQNSKVGGRKGGRREGNPWANDGGEKKFVVDDDDPLPFPSLPLLRPNFSLPAPHRGIRKPPPHRERFTKSSCGETAATKVDLCA